MTTGRLIFLVYIVSLLMTPEVAMAVHRPGDEVLQVAGPAAALAQTPESCNGLDIVFLLDQSKSMEHNDRYDNRVEAIRYAIARIGENAIYFCPEAKHRVAVIGFWDSPGNAEDTKLYLGPTLIDPDPDQFAKWQELRQTLGDQVVPELLGSTDFISAFERAVPILQAWRQEVLGSLPRKQAVIVLTDGGPCVEDEGCLSIGFSVSQYMERLEQLTGPKGDSFPWIETEQLQGVYIWLVAFNDARGGVYDYLLDEELMTSWQRIAQSHGGDVLILQKGVKNEQINTDLAPKVTEILDSLLGSELLKSKCGEPIRVPVYVDSLILHVFKIGANPGVNITDAVVTVRHERRDGSTDLFQNGEIVNGTGNIREYTQDGPNERYIFVNPDPGEWYVTAEKADCKDVDVRYKPVEFNYQVTTPTPNQTLLRVDEPPTYFVYQITERLTNSPIREIEEYPLLVKLIVQPPPGPGIMPQECDLKRQANGDYQCEAPIQLPVAGGYSWQVEGLTPSVSPGVQWDRVFVDTGSFEAENVVVPVDYKIVLAGEERQPLYRPGSSIPCRGGAVVPIQVMVALFDPNHPEGPLDPTQIARDDPSQLFTATLFKPNDQREAIQLSLQSGPAGTHLAGIGGANDSLEGEYVVRLVPNPANVRQDYQLLRTDPIQTRLIREYDLLSQPGSCYVVGAGAIVPVILVLGFLTWCFLTRPVGIITFEDDKTGEMLYEELLGKLRPGWCRSYKSTDSGLSKVGLKKMEVSKAKQSGKRAIYLTLYDKHGQEILSKELLGSGEKRKLGHVESGKDETNIRPDVIVRYV